MWNEHGYPKSLILVSFIWYSAPLFFFGKLFYVSDFVLLVENAEAMDQMDHTPSDDAKEFMNWMRSTLSKYWILICCSSFLLVALQNDVSLFQIFYMVIFLFGFIIYQVWKGILDHTMYSCFFVLVLLFAFSCIIVFFSSCFRLSNVSHWPY